jgi:stage II sporulation protein D
VLLALLWHFGGISTLRADPSDTSDYPEVYLLLRQGKTLEAIQKTQEIMNHAIDPSFRIETGKLLGNILAVYLGEYARAANEVKTLLDWTDDIDIRAELIFMAGMFFWEAQDIEMAREQFRVVASKYDETLHAAQAVFMLKQCQTNQAKSRWAEPALPERPALKYQRSQEIRVMLLKGVKKARIASPHGLAIIDGEKLLSVPKGGILIEAVGNHFLINRKHRVTASQLTIRPMLQQEPLSIMQKRYRGTALLRAEGGKFDLVNSIPFEDYLKGVIPAEVIPSWEFEALKAQAVASRTFAYRKILAHDEDDSHLDATIFSQVYGGYDAEREKTNRAVMETAGEMLTYKGKPVAAYFHSNSGGYTENAYSVWDTDFPYLQSNPDPYSIAASDVRWEIRFTSQAIEQKLRENGYDIRDISNIVPAATTESRRISKVMIHHRRGQTLINSNDFRIILDPLKLKSTMFSLERTNDSYLFRGKGFGHGVGMSQWGANAMAKAGKNYQEILRFYYQNIQITRISQIP